VLQDKTGWSDLQMTVTGFILFKLWFSQPKTKQTMDFFFNVVYPIVLTFQIFSNPLILN
jgi:hypothetical protein